MTCRDCGLTVEAEEVGDSKILAHALEYIAKTGRCFACESVYEMEQKIKRLKGEVVECQTKED